MEGEEGGNELERDGGRGWERGGWRGREGKEEDSLLPRSANPGYGPEYHPGYIVGL